MGVVWLRALNLPSHSILTGTGHLEFKLIDDVDDSVDRCEVTIVSCSVFVRVVQTLRRMSCGTPRRLC